MPRSRCQKWLKLLDKVDPFPSLLLELAHAEGAYAMALHRGNGRIADICRQPDRRHHVAPLHRHLLHEPVLTGGMGTGQLCPGVSATSGTLTLAFKELFPTTQRQRISIEVHFVESVRIITLTDDSPNDGARAWS